MNFPTPEGVEKSGVEMSSQSMGVKLGVEKSGVEMSFNHDISVLTMVKYYHEDHFLCSKAKITV